MSPAALAVKADGEREAQSIRACLRCGSDFRSAGKHNRLCDPCRGAGLGREFEGV